MLAGDVAQARRVLALAEGASRAGEVVAHRTVGLEQLVALGNVAITLGVSTVGDRWAGTEGSHVSPQVGNLLVAEEHLFSLGGLGAARACQRHTACADLEVNRCGPHAGQAGTDLAALTIDSVAAGAVGQEELPSGGHVSG